MEKDREGITLVLVRPRGKRAGADLLLRSGFTSTVRQQLCNARKHFINAIVAAMTPDGRLAVLANGLATDIDVDQVEVVHGTFEEFVRNTDSLTCEEAKRR